MGSSSSIDKFLKNYGYSTDVAGYNNYVRVNLDNKYFQNFINHNLIREKYKFVGSFTIRGGLIDRVYKKHIDNFDEMKDD